MSFDFDDYLLQRAEGTLGATAPIPSQLSTKQQKVAEATASKRAALESITRQQAHNEGTVVGGLDFLGLTPDGAVGNLVNTVVASGAELAGSAANKVASAIDAYNGLEDQMSGLTDEHEYAYAMEQKGIASPEQIEKLNERSQLVGSLSGNMTMRDRIARSQENKQTTQGIRELGDFSKDVAYKNDGMIPSTVQDAAGDVGVSALKGAIAIPEIAVGLADIPSFGHAGKFLEEAGFKPGEAKEILDSLYSHRQQIANASVAEQKGFFGTLNELLANPSVAAHMIVESIPAMLAGGVVGRGVTALGGKAQRTISPIAASALGEGAVMTGGAAERIRQQSEDGLLTGKQIAAAVGTGAAGALTANLFGRLGKLTKLGDVDTTLVQGGAGTASRNLGYRIPGSAALEGTEEMLQSSAETMLENYALDRGITEGVGNAAATGLVTGGAMGAAGGTSRRPLTDVEVASEEVTKLVRSRAPKGMEQAQFDEQIKGRATKAKGVLETERARILGEVDAAVPPSVLEMKKGLDADYQRLEEGTFSSEDEKAKFRAIYDKKTEIYDSSISKHEMEHAEQLKTASDLERKSQDLDKVLDGINARAESGTAPSTDESKTVKQKTAIALKKVREANKVSQQASADASPIKADPEAQKAAKDLVALSMEVPDMVDAETAEMLASDTSNGLSDNERQYFRTFSAATVAANKARTDKDVSQHIFKGDLAAGFKGIPQYTEEVRTALRGTTPNMANANKSLGGLKRFTGGHKAKYEAMSDALNESLDTGKQVQIIREADSPTSWVRAPRFMSDAELRDHGGLNVHKGLATTIDQMGTEVEALETAVAHNQAMIDMRDPSKPAKSPVKVQQPSKKPAPQKAEKAKPVQEKLPEPSVVTEPVAQAEATVTDTQAKEESTEDVPVPQEDWSSDLDSLDQEEPEAALPKAPKTAETQGIKIDRTSEAAAIPLNKDGKAPATGKVRTLLARTSVASFDPNTTFAKRFKQTNWIAEFFTQNSGERKAKGTQEASAGRPLVKEYNFLDVMTSTPETLRPYLKSITASDVAVGDALTSFAQVADELRAAVLDLLPRLDQAGIEARYNNLFTYLADYTNESPALDQNVTTAITAAIVQWVDEAAKGGLLTNNDINRMLGRDSAHPVNQAESDLLREMVSTQSLANRNLGRNIVDALGLAPKDGSIPANLSTRLIDSAGAFALGVMLDQGIAKRHVFSSEEVAAMTGTALEDSGASLGFISLVREGEFTSGLAPLSPLNTKIVGIQSEVRNLVPSLFGIESQNRDPSLKPLDFNQETVGQDGQLVPTELKEILDHSSKRPWQANQSVNQVMSAVSEEVFGRMAGIKDAGPLVPKRLRKGIVAANEGIQRSIRNAQGFFSYLYEEAEDSINSHFFLTPDVWKHHRVGIKGTVINPQADKVHRGLVDMADWKTSINVLRDDDKEMIDQLKLAIFESMGKNLDAVPDSVTLSAYSNWESSVGDALDVLDKLEAGSELTGADQSTLEAAVAQGGENLHSLKGLIEAAKLRRAYQEGANPSFDTYLTREVDGKTNGGMLANAQVGAFSSVEAGIQFLNAGGMYSAGTENYKAYKAVLGNRDMYEETAALIRASLLNKLNAYSSDSAKASALEEMSSVFRFVGKIQDEKGDISKDGRNLVKRPDTAILYGSGIGAALAGMSEAFVETVYKRLGKIALGNTKDSLNQWVDDTNALLPKGMKLPTGQSIVWYLENPLGLKAENAVSQYYSNFMKEHLEYAVDQQFGQFMEARNTLNSAARIAHEMFSAAFKAEREKLIQDGITNGSIPVAKNGTPLADISRDQEEALFERLLNLSATAHSPFSANGEDLKEGIYPSKSENSTDSSSLYRSQAKFSKGIPFTGAKDGSTKSINVSGQARSPASPGVATLVLLTQSIDSGISARAYAKLSALNVHDAHILGLKDVKDGAQNLNQETYSILRDYSMVGEIDAMFERSLAGFAKYIKENGTDSLDLSGLGKELNAQLRKVFDPKVLGKTKAAEMLAAAQKSPLSVIANNLRKVRKQSDSTRLSVLSSLTAMDQYPLEGGTYQVTEEDRLAAESMKSELSNLADKMRIPFTEQVNLAAVKGIQSAQGKVTQGEEVKELKSAAPKATAWGQLGSPAVAPSQELVQLFSKSKTPARNDVLRALKASIDSMKSERTREQYGMLLKALSRTTSKELKVVYVDKTTTLPSHINMGQAARGSAFYSSNGTIYVKGTDYATSRLTPEALLHEMVHAAVFDVLDQDGALPKDAQQLVDHLRGIQSAAKSFAEKQGNALATTWAIPLNDLQEFVAWGMTNPAFQREVLSGAQVAPLTGNALVDAVKGLIDTLVKILFNKSSRSEQEIATSALTQLVESTAALMGQGESGGLTAPRTLSMEASRMPEMLEVFDALGTNAREVSQEFSTHLRTMATDLVEPLHGVFGAVRAEALADQSMDMRDRFTQALDEGVAPLALSVRGILKMSDQEAFMAEQVATAVRAALDSKDRTTSVVYSELVKLHRELAGSLVDSDFYQGDWASATAEEKELAKAKRSHLLDIPEGGARSDYLSRFAALALTSQEINTLLKRPTAKVEKASNDVGWVARIHNMVERLMEFMAGKITHTWAGQEADSKIHSLVKDLVRIEAKSIEKLSNPRSQWLERGEEILDSAAGKAREVLMNAANSDKVAQSKHGAIRLLGKTVDAVGQDRVDAVMDASFKLRDQIFKKRHGVVASTFSEMKGFSAQMLQLIRLAKSNEQERKHLHDWTAQNLMESFQNNVTEEQRESLSFLIRSDLTEFVKDAKDLSHLKELLMNPEAIKGEISSLEVQLPKAQKAMFKRRVHALGRYMVTGDVAIDNLMLNAENIAKGYLSKDAGALSSADVKNITPVLDRLSSLYALKYVPAHAKAHLADLIDKEGSRTDGGNGVLFTALMHNNLKKESKEKLFENDSALMIKGYTPEIHNPYNEVVAATAIEGEQLVREGWERVTDAPLMEDAEDTRKEPRHLYILRDRGMMGRQTGALSLRGMRAKGSKRHQGLVDKLEGNLRSDNLRIVQKMNSVKMAKEAAAASKGIESKEAHMVPVLNQLGEVSNYRYMMGNRVRDQLLERDNRFDQLLGAMNAGTFDKVSSREQNMEVFQAIHKVYEEEYAKNPDAFTKVSVDSPDKESRETWNLLSDASRGDMERVWGGKTMWVRHDHLDLVTGYRKYSLANIFEKDPRTPLNMRSVGMSYEDERTLLETAFTWLMRDVFRLGDTAALRVRQAEDMWQALVKEVKDIIVIRMGVTLAMNVLSNMTVLWISGVPVKDIARNHWVAWRGAREYQANAKELFALENDLSTGTSKNVAKTQQRIRQLKDAIDRNPAKELIDNGMLPTIVDDVEVSDEASLYSTKGQRMVDRYTGWVPEKVGDVFNTYIYMGKGTKGHNFMSELTQMSDFVGRYVLYQNLTQGKNPVSKEEALKTISDAFVNYDLPSGKSMQYANDMGILMFTKYYLRIQRVIFNLVKDHPARAVGMALLSEYLQGMESILNSSMLTRLGNNPFEIGALQYPGVLDELGSIKLMDGIIR